MSTMCSDYRRTRRGSCAALIACALIVVALPCCWYMELETTRDDKGVWFISGSKNEDLYDIMEAMGYAVATDRLWQAELYRRTARGRLCEVFGPSQLASDIFMRTTGYSDSELQAAFENLDTESRSVVNGYIAGFNRRIAEVRADPALLPFEFVMAAFSPEDWTCRDVLAWLAVLQREFDPMAYDTEQIENAALYQQLAAYFPGEYAGMFEDLRWLNDPDALTYIPREGFGITIIPKRMMRALEGEREFSFPDLRNAADSMVEMRNTINGNLEKINARATMGSYAWVVSGDRTKRKKPIIYSGPQMGFSVPSITLEGSIRAGGLNISGMTVAGIPGIIIGRTPHHAWSMQVGHAHTVDYYLESPADVTLHRTETIKVRGQADITLPVFRSTHGPVVNPMPYDPSAGPVIAWKYAHWGYEFDSIRGMLKMIRANSMNEFGKAIELMAVSQHYCYADRDGNIAYWMSGRDPVRPAGEYRFPQGFTGVTLEWNAANLIARSTDRNTSQGFYCGWNNKSNPNYIGPFGPFHRAQVIHDYLAAHNRLSFEDVRDLALNIAATDSFGGGGNPWKFVKDYFTAAVNANPTQARKSALALVSGWDGHFVDGGPSQWAAGTDRADGWILMDRWTRKVLDLTFTDELGGTPDKERLFNVVVHALRGEQSGIVNNYDWFQDVSDPQNIIHYTANEIIIAALDAALAELGARPWGTGTRGIIQYRHQFLGIVHTTPLASRSTYAHCVEMGHNGPYRIESMFPLGESGTILLKNNAPVFDENFFSMAPLYDAFTPRDFPLFKNK